MRDGRSVNDTSLPPDRSYSFKCHRQDLKAEIHNPECEQGAHGTVPRGSSNNTSSNNKPQHIFPVNVLCFNKSTKGSFVSGGGDGSLTYWDGLRRSKLRSGFLSFPTGWLPYSLGSQQDCRAIGERLGRVLHFILNTGVVYGPDRGLLLPLALHISSVSATSS